MGLDTEAVNTGQMHGEGQTLKKVCKHCQTENVFIVPKYEIVNSFGVSMLVFPHPDPQNCEKCGKPYQMVLRGVEHIAVSFMPLKDQTGGIIMAPPGLKIPREN